jgi:hypothetical protein
MAAGSTRRNKTVMIYSTKYFTQRVRKVLSKVVVFLSKRRLTRACRLKDSTWMDSTACSLYVLMSP